MVSRCLGFALILAACGSSFAGAQEGTRLAWNNCRDAGGSGAKAFACNTNSGLHSLIASVYAPEALDQVAGFELTVHLQFHADIPQWWQLRDQLGQTGQCRNGSLSASSFPGTATCVDPYQGQAAGGIGFYRLNDPYPGRIRLFLVFATPAGMEMALSPGVEYFIARILINNSKTVGTGACSGCSTPACLRLTNVKIARPSSGDVNVGEGHPWEVSRAGWQSSCNPCEFPQPSDLQLCGVCPTPRTTWGRVKAMYR